MKMKNGRLTDFLIELDHHQGVYSPGDRITGQIVLLVTGGIFKFSQLSILLNGEASVEHLKQASELRTTIKNQFNICNIPLTIFPHGTENEAIIGRNEYRFMIELPKRDYFPTSFEYKEENYIRYYLKAELDSIPDKIPYSSTILVKLVNHISISKPQYLASVNRKIESEPKTSNSLIGSIEIDRGAYCVGESIQIQADFKNISNESITPKVALCQKIEAIYEDGEKKCYIEPIPNAELIGEQLGPGKEGKWLRKELMIPPTVPSILNCPLLSLNYEVLVTAFKSSGNKNKHSSTPSKSIRSSSSEKLVELPMVVGTLGLRGEPTFHLQEDQVDSMGKRRGPHLLRLWRLIVFLFMIVICLAVAYYFFQQA